MKGTISSFDFPADIYTPDVAGIAQEAISRHGLREWRSLVLTNEIHGHLGIYSTLGAKMGIRALEEFEALGIADGHVRVFSRAGSTPPVSCLNDGLQISTGATLGHGLISVSPDASDGTEASKRAATRQKPSVEAIFERNGVRIKLALKPEFDARIQADIKEGTARYGRSPEYWEYVRGLALKYWAEWSRAEIFAITAA